MTAHCWGLCWYWSFDHSSFPGYSSSVTGALVSTSASCLQYRLWKSWWTRPRSISCAVHVVKLAPVLFAIEFASHFARIHYFAIPTEHLPESQQSHFSRYFLFRFYPLFCFSSNLHWSSVARDLCESRLSFSSLILFVVLQRDRPMVAIVR